MAVARAVRKSACNTLADWRSDKRPSDVSMFGAMIAATIATMAMTTSASSSVKPACGLPASDILRLAGAARLLVGTEREDIDFAVRSGDAVEIRITPRIDQRAVLLQVWPVPAIGGLRRSDERLQALLRR